MCTLACTYCWSVVFLFIFAIVVYMCRVLPTWPEPCSVPGRLWPLQLRDSTSTQAPWIQYVSISYYYHRNTIDSVIISVLTVGAINRPAHAIKNSFHTFLCGIVQLSVQILSFSSKFLWGLPSLPRPSGFYWCWPQCHGGRSQHVRSSEHVQYPHASTSTLQPGEHLSP